jgi:type 1 glutamine amidotransferase
MFAVFIAGALPGFAKSNHGKIRVLIVDGFSNHDWQQTTQLLRGILDGAGKFEVDVSTAPQDSDSPEWAAWRPKFSNYDVVIQTCNENANNGLLLNLKKKPDWPEAVNRDFAEYVRKGGGVYIYHAAENAFVGWKEYEQMVGLSWRDANYGTAIRIDDAGGLVRIPPNDGRATNHGKRQDVLVTRLGNDPIHAGLPRAWMSPDMEVYYYARGPAQNINVLAYARDTDPKLGLLWPVEWTTTYGKGRVYISTYGHVWPGDVDPPGMRCAAVQTIIPRALEWLARRPVSFPVPADFPGTTAVSVRAAAK